MVSQLFEINCLVPKKFLGINDVYPFPFLHQFFRGMLVGCEVATIAREKPEQTVRGIPTNQEVGHSFVVVKIFAA